MEARFPLLVQEEIAPGASVGSNGLLKSASGPSPGLIAPG
jgi:hypothetical protein